MSIQDTQEGAALGERIAGIAGIRERIAGIAGIRERIAGIAAVRRGGMHRLRLGGIKKI